MYQLAIFDFDGTLVDSAPGIVQVMEQVVEEYELPGSVLDRWRHLVGVPLDTQMEIIFPERDTTYRARIAQRYRCIYDTRLIGLCPPFPGLTSMLDTLKAADIACAIASSKRRNIIEPVLDHHDLSHHFQTIVGQQDIINHKPHPEAVHHIVQKLNVDHQDAVVIGDSMYDMEMAKNAGVDGIAVTTGIHTREILLAANPLHIVSGLEEVAPLILNGRMRTI